MRSQNRQKQLRYSQQQRCHRWQRRRPRQRQHRWQRRPSPRPWPLRQRLALHRGLDRVLRLSRLQRPCLHRLQCLDLGPVRERLLLAILFPCLNPV